MHQILAICKRQQGLPMDKILSEYIKGILRGRDGKIFLTLISPQYRELDRWKFFSKEPQKGTCSDTISVTTFKWGTKGEILRNFPNLGVYFGATQFSEPTRGGSICSSPNSITPTLRQSLKQVHDKVTNLSRTPIMKVHNRNHVANFHDLCPRQVHDFVGNLSQTLSRTFPVHCNGLNSIRVTQTGLLRTRHGLCRIQLDMSRLFCPRLSWFVSVTFTETSWFHDLLPFVSATIMICVHNFPCGEVSAKVGVMEFGL